MTTPKTLAVFPIVTTPLAAVVNAKAFLDVQPAAPTGQVKAIHLWSWSQDFTVPGVDPATLVGGDFVVASYTLPGDTRLRGFVDADDRLNAIAGQGRAGSAGASDPITSSDGDVDLDGAISAQDMGQIVDVPA